MLAHCTDLAKAVVVRSLRQSHFDSPKQFAQRLSCDHYTIKTWEDCSLPPTATQLDDVRQILRIQSPNAHQLITELAHLLEARLSFAALSIPWQFNPKPH